MVRVGREGVRKVENLFSCYQYLTGGFLAGGSCLEHGYLKAWVEGVVVSYFTALVPLYIFFCLGLGLNHWGKRRWMAGFVSDWTGGAVRCGTGLMSSRILV